MALRIFLIGLVLSAAVVLGVVIYQSPFSLASRTPPAPTAPPPPLTINYLVAARPLPAGTLVRDSDIALKSVQPSRLPPHAITDSPTARSELRGALVPRYLDAGAAVTLEDVLRPRDRGFLATVLPPGARAVSVAVDAVTGVAGLIWPGDRVDVLLTQQVEGNAAASGHQVVSRTVLTDIRVIAVDQEIVQGATGDVHSAGHVARTVTLEVSPEEAERLTVGQRIGVLSLAIRPLKDLAPPRDEPVFGADVSPELVHSAAPAAPGMQIIQGDQRSMVRFQ